MNKSFVFNWDLVNYWDPWADEGAVAAIKSTLDYIVRRRFEDKYDGLYSIDIECLERNPSWDEIPDYKTEISFDETITDDVANFIANEFKQHIVYNFSNRIKFVS